MKLLAKKKPVFSINMKILYQSRVDLYNPRGGDTSQMEQTKKAIEKLDPSISIDIKPEVQVKDIKNYDLVHIFNLDWVCETYLQALWAKQNNKPIVLSAIHHSENEVRKYEDLYRFDIRRIYNLLIPSQALRDEWKNIYRAITNLRKAYPSLIQVLSGIRYQQRESLKMSDVVLVQTEREAEDIRRDFQISEFKSEKVVNGVDLEVFKQAKPEDFNQLIKERFKTDISNDDILLNVGRIEPRKNQLKLIQSFENLQKKGKLKNHKLVFIGSFTKRSPEYKLRFLLKTKLNKNILYLGFVPQNVVASAMSHKGIYVHPSWFETTGLVAIEAAVAGMKVIASGDRIKEYLGDKITYCRPESEGSLERAIINSVEKEPLSDEFKAELARKYSWEQAARQTITIYRNLLNHEFSSQ